MNVTFMYNDVSVFNEYQYTWYLLFVFYIMKNCILFMKNCIFIDQYIYLLFVWIILGMSQIIIVSV